VAVCAYTELGKEKV